MSKVVDKFCFSKEIFFVVIFLIAVFSFFVVTNKINSNQKTTVTKAETTLPIIGGRPADPGEWPFMVFIYNKKYLENHKREYVDYKYPHKTYVSQSAIGGAFCGGTLIANQWVLTAAHCLNNVEEKNVYDQSLKKYVKKYVVTKKNPNDIGIAVGFTDSRENILKEDWEKRFMDIEYLYPHLSYAENIPLGKHFLDIGLIKLKNKSSYKTISLNNNPRLISKDKQIKILGWGTRSTFFLNYAPNFYLYEADTKISANTNSYGYFFSSDPNGNPCYGDSGGPAIGFDKSGSMQVGIIHSGNSEGCVDSWYLDVSRQLEWIYQISGVKASSGSFIGKPSEWITPTITKVPTPKNK